MKIEIRNYREADCSVLAQLFYDTVRTVNLRDYTQEQVEAWATGQVDLGAWNASFLEHDTVVALVNSPQGEETIVGFCDMEKSGYLDRLYVHKDFQGRGVASKLCDELERRICGSITTHASITARPFFERRGYEVEGEQQVERRGQLLTNFIMKKIPM